ncbi:AsmA family protein [Psychromonas marina]|nr:AsmA family protein [Psychromonas marina]
MKRFFIAISLLLVLLIALVISFIALFDVNDYRDWASDQIKQSTGYDVRFQSIENHWLAEKRFSLIGVTLYQQQQRVMRIEKLDIEVDKLELWQRLLAIKSINISGVEVDKPLFGLATTTQTVSENDNVPPQNSVKLQKLAWQRLHINRLNISAVNGVIEHQGQRLMLEGGQLELQDLLVINNQQLQLVPVNADITLAFKHLQLQAPQQQLQIDNLQLSAQGDLLQRQAKLDITTSSIVTGLSAQQLITVDALQLGLQFNKNRLLLEHLNIDAFSGSLAMQADAVLDIKLLPKPSVSVQQVTLHSLLAHDMSIDIPTWLMPAEQQNISDEQQKNELLPLQVLLIKQLKLDNISVYSANSALPLQLKNLQLTLNDLYLIEQQRWINFPPDDAQAGSFSLAFERLGWQETLIEQLSIAGSLSDDDQGLLLLKQLLFEK